MRPTSDAASEGSPSLSVRALVAAAGVAAIVAASPVLPSYAAGPVTDVYVATPANGGSDANSCSQAAPCASVAAAIFAADSSGTTIHVGAGTFDGPVRPGALSKSVTIEGLSPDETTLTASEGSDAYDATVVELYGDSTTTLSGLTVSGGPAGGITVTDPAVLHADHVVSTGGGCDLYVDSASVDVSDSTFSDGGSGGACGGLPGYEADVAVNNGTVSLTRTRILDPAVNGDGLVTNAGDITLDQSYVDSASNHDDTNDSVGVHAKDGQVIVTRSTIHGFGTGAFNAGATLLVSDSTFQGNTVGVTSDSGQATVVRSTFEGELASLQQELSGTLATAGSVLGSDTIKNCSGTIDDLGYNLASDASCAFTAASSHENVATNLDSALSDVGGSVDTVALRNPSEAVDLIPVGATYGGSATPLCPAAGTTDVRGVSRPAGAGCDAGSMELAGTVTTLTAPTKAAPHAEVDLEANVEVPDVGVDGIGTPDGVVVFSAGDQVLCDGVETVLGHAACVTTDLGTGRRSVTARFYASTGSIVDGSTSSAREVLVGTSPTISGPGKAVVEVGKPATITERATGKPTPTLALVKGKLPAGLRLAEKAGKVTISGKAKASGVGRHVLELRATNLMGKKTRTLTIVVKRG